MAALWIAPDNTVGGFVDGRPVDPESHEGPARWAVGERHDPQTERRERVQGCPQCRPGGVWHDPSRRCAAPRTHCGCRWCRS